MRGKKLSVLSLILALLTPMVVLGSAQTTAMLYVDPAQLVDYSLEPGSTFSVDVKVADIVDLYGYEFKLGYDTNVLTATAYTVGDFFPGYFVWKDDIDDTTGTVWLAITLPLGTPPPGISGSGTLATIEFTVDAEGVSTLDLYDTLLNDWRPTPIDHDVRNGFVATTGDLAVSIRTAWVEDRHYDISKDPDQIIDLSAMVKNKGSGVTAARAVFNILNEELVVVDTVVSNEASMAPNDITTLIVGWSGYTSPSAYFAEVGVEYLDASGEWVGGLKGSPTGHRETMTVSFTVED